MKKLFVVLLTFTLFFAFTACGGGSGNSQDGSSGGSDKAAAGAKEWPTADFITPAMEYTGNGDITATDFIDGATQEDGRSMWSVYINGADLDDAKAYIEVLKADGFTYYSTTGESEPEAAFEFGYYQWDGEADGGDRYVIVYVSEEPDTYGSAEYTMYIMMMDSNMYK